jgi:hypothetical protein
MTKGDGLLPVLASLRRGYAPGKKPGHASVFSMNLKHWLVDTNAAWSNWNSAH